MVDKTSAGAGAEPIVIKKYANRRLYNTASSSYVTLDHLSEMVRGGVEFIVLDAKTSEDITRSVLTQIIFEQESRGQSLLPVAFLRRLIRFYGDQMQSFLPSYLDMSMETFSKGQERMREQLTRAWGGRTPIAAFEDQARQNMEMFEQAMRLWAPFAAPGAGGPAAAEKNEAAASPPPAASDAAALQDLQRQVELMQKQLEALAGSRKP